MSYLMIALIPCINLLNLSWIIKCLFLRNMEPLSGLDIPKRFYAIFSKVDNFCDVLFCFHTRQSLSEKGSALKGKKNCSKGGANSFILE